MKDQQALLNNKDADIRAMDEHIHRLEEQFASLKRVGQADRDELAKLRATVAALDREKDALQSAVDEKTEMGVKQQETVAARVSHRHRHVLKVFCCYILTVKY